MRTVLGIAAIIIGFVGYVPYFKDMRTGKTKPHAFSWFIWGILTGIAFFAQITGKGGAGAWVSGVTALVCLGIAGVAWRVARQNILAVDWWFLAGAVAAIGLWALTKDPLGSVVLITIIDVLAFIPTFRKSYSRPNEETTSTYNVSALKYVVSLFALSTISLTTTLYPISLILTNSIFVAMVYWRRAILLRDESTS